MQFTKLLDIIALHPSVKTNSGTQRVSDLPRAIQLASSTVETGAQSA